MKSKRDYHKRTQQRQQQKDGIYKNRAAIEDTPMPFQDVTDAPCCGEELVFAMRDNHHPFSIGLSTILSCLAIAEKEGYVPQLPFEWWNSLRRP